MLLSDATIVTYVVNLHTGDIDRIHIDKSLVGKLSGENASDSKHTFELVVYMV